MIKGMIKLMACHLPSDRVKKKYYAVIFSGNMYQLCEKQTELCGQISAVNKTYKLSLLNVQKISEMNSTLNSYPQFNTCN